MATGENAAVVHRAYETSRRTLGAVGRGRLLELNCISLGKPKLNTQEGSLPSR